MSASTTGCDPQGSHWRRWDPHVHIPGTLFNDQFGNLSITEALEVLASRKPEIEVVCITDYYTTASFRRATEAWSAGAGASIRLLIPNVELRLDIPTTAGKGVNLHLLCPPEDVDELDRFLGALDFSSGGRSYRADTDGLVALGRAFDGNPQLDREAALRSGAMQFKVSFETLRKQFEADAWAKKNCLVAVAGSQGDGSSGLRTEDGAFTARRQAIEAFSHIVFTSSPQAVAFWSGKGADSIERLTEIYGGEKVCLHGSDAHDQEHLGMPDESRYTWLKGDPSFETLRMACLSPQSRAHIGSSPPSVGHGHDRISRLTVNSPQWFTAGTVPVNPGLVAIIGARGSGKTALADLIAAGAGSDQPFSNGASFVRRAGRLLATSVAEVEWSHGEITQCDFARDAEQFADSPRAVRYLSQQFVERLCAADGVSDDLLAEIERVVFNAWPVEERQGATTFQELLDIRLGAVRSRRQSEIDAIEELSAAITHQRMLKEVLPKKKTERTEQQKALETLTNETTQLTSKADKTSSDRLAVVNGALQLRQQEFQSIDRQVTELAALESETQSARNSRFPTFSTQLREKHSAAGLTDEEWRCFTVDFVSDVTSIIQSARAKAEKARTALAGSVDEDRGAPPLDHVTAANLGKLSVAELSAERFRLQRLVGLDEQRTKQLEKLNQRTTEFTGRITKLDTEIEIAGHADQRISELTDARLDRYASYFGALLEEERELQELYAPLSKFLTDFGPSVAKLRFSVRRTVNIGAWAARGEALIDSRTAGTFYGTGQVTRIASQELLPAWQSGDGSAAADAIRSFSASHSGDIRTQRRVERDDLDAYREWEQAVSSWLYDAEHITLSYSLEYDGLNIERLSPGSRGIVLLLLYLAVDQEETDPLIIDQPEENLDPESVYSELVALFRSASRRRQIIMVTHNANLVVNTDVDQVIVAHCGPVEEGKLPALTYQLGGLEDPEIRTAVCEVLEGGAEAFRQRARRLRIEM
jgi:hypothetical protein